MRTPRRLIDLHPGSSATIAALRAEPALLQRLDAMGVRPGQTVRMLRRAWWAGPLHVRVGMTELMMRRRDAAGVDLAA